jgi:hypothetical protein
MKRGFWIAKILKVLVVVALVIGLVGFVAMGLWNWLVPALFSGPVITYWQALGLLVLARLLVGGFRHHGGRGRFGPWGHHMGQQWRERWEQMTPEEREQLRGRFREGWGRRGSCGDREAAEPKA